MSAIAEPKQEEILFPAVILSPGNNRTNGVSVETAKEKDVEGCAPVQKGKKK